MAGIDVAGSAASLIPITGDRAQGRLASIWEYLVDHLITARITCVGSVFEPVMDQVSWIKGIESGHASGWLLEVGKGPWAMLNPPVEIPAQGQALPGLPSKPGSAAGFR